MQHFKTSFSFSLNSLQFLYVITLIAFPPFNCCTVFRRMTYRCSTRALFQLSPILSYYK